MLKRIVVAAVCVSLVASIVIGCGMSKRDRGALIGAGAGAVVGGVIGDKAGNTAVGAIIGAAVGGAAGAYIGNYMDKQAEEMRRDLEGAQIERVGEGIKITFASGILFDVNKSTLRPEAQQNIRELAAILNKYDNTTVLIEGHTDSDGSDEYNLTLSRSRAESVSGYLAGQNVSSSRFIIQGYGEQQPVASNETAAGKQANRRVEIAIYANDKLKKIAEDQATGKG